MLSLKIFTWDVLDAPSSLSVVDLEALAVSFHNQKMFELLNIVHVFDLCIMLLRVLEVTSIVIFDGIYERSILPDHAQFDDVIGEFLPLKCAVIVDINLSEQLNELLHELSLVSVLGPEVVEHDFEELFEGEPVRLAPIEVLLDLLKLSIVQVTHDILIVVISVLVWVL